MLGVAFIQGKDGGRIFDVSDPAHPRETAVVTGESARANTGFMGDFLRFSFTTKKITHFKIYNIHAPARPIQCYEGERYYLAHPGGDYDIFATDGKRLFVADQDGDDEEGKHSVVVRDITASPTSLGTLRLAMDNADLDKRGQVFAVRDGKLVAADSSTTLNLATVGRQGKVWYYRNDSGPSDRPVGDSGEPRRIKSPVAPDEHPGAMQFKLTGDRGYLVDGEGGLQVLEMRDPAHPRRLGRFAGTLKSPVIRAVEDDLVFVTSEDAEGLTAIDCSKPAAPKLRATFPGAAGPMSIQGRRAYVAAGEAGLQILDISKPEAIRMLGSYQAGEAVTDLVTSGSLVFLLAKDLVVVDAADPARPRLISKTPLLFEEGEKWEAVKGSGSLKKLGPAIYALQQEQLSMTHTYAANLKVIDIRNPAAPRPLPLRYLADPYGNNDPLASGELLDQIREAPAVKSPTSGGYLCLPAHDYHVTSWDSFFHAEMKFYDLTDPLRPVPVGRTAALQSPPDPVLYKNTLYLADGEGGLVILRPRQPGR